MHHYMSAQELMLAILYVAVITAPICWLIFKIDAMITTRLRELRND